MGPADKDATSYQADKPQTIGYTGCIRKVRPSRLQFK